MKIKFINANQNAPLYSYLPAIIAEALFQRIKRKELQVNEDENRIYRSKQDGSYGKNVGGRCGAGDAEPSA